MKIRFYVLILVVTLLSFTSVSFAGKAEEHQKIKNFLYDCYGEITAKGYDVRDVSTGEQVAFEYYFGEKYAGIIYSVDRDGDNDEYEYSSIHILGHFKGENKKLDTQMFLPRFSKITKSDVLYSFK